MHIQSHEQYNIPAHTTTTNSLIDCCFRKLTQYSAADSVHSSTAQSKAALPLKSDCEDDINLVKAHLSWSMLAGVVDRHTQVQQLLVSSSKVVKVLVLVLGIQLNILSETLVLDQCLQQTAGLSFQIMHQFWRFNHPNDSKLSVRCIKT